MPRRTVRIESRGPPASQAPPGSLVRYTGQYAGDRKSVDGVYLVTKDAGTGDPVWVALRDFKCHVPGRDENFEVLVPGTVLTIQV